MKSRLFWTLVVQVLAIPALFAQITVFTYQGRLNDGAATAQGFFDIDFGLHAAPTGGSPLATVNRPGVIVSNGLFTVELDFGAGPFNGAERWLEISLAPAGGGPRQTLSPRQRISATPQAIHALNAAQAGSVPPGSITALQLAPGAAAANLGSNNLAGLPSTTIVMSDREVNRAMLGAGLVPVGTSINVATDSWTSLPSGPPATGVIVPGRWSHQAVWTGTEMLIIGGIPDNYGLRYNPTANTWTAMNKTNAPLIGASVHAAWTGTQLIVWDAYHQIGGRYTPSTDSWTAMTDANAPSARKGACAAYVNGYFVVWGGANALEYDVGSLLNTGGRYNPANNTWTATATVGAPERRAFASATTAGTEMLVFGGTITNRVIKCVGLNCSPVFLGFDAINDGGRYNPVANTWAAIPSGGVKRSGHAAAWSGTELYVWGGRNPEGESSLSVSGTPVNSGARYNLAADAWTLLPSSGAPSEPFGQTAVWAGTNLIVWGRSGPSPGVNTGARYSRASDSWTSLPNEFLDDREDHTAVWTGTQMIVWGGLLGNYLAAGDGARYNLTANTWSAMSLPPATGEPAERSRATGVWTGNALVVWGGDADGYGLRSGGIYRPGVGWTNTPLSGAPSGRSSHTAIWTGSEMMIWGGTPGVGNVPVNTGARFHVASNRWFAVSTVNAPSPRVGHTAVWTGTEVIIFGGRDYTNVYTPAWLGNGGRYNPATDTWTPIATNAAAGGSGHVAVWTGREMLIWGGYTTSGRITPTTTFRNTGFSYDPASDTWSSLPASGLSARRAHSAVWTGDELLIWGGEGATGQTNTGARFNPQLGTWTPMTTSNAPLARYVATAVWADPPGKAIIWGGVQGGNYVNTGSLYDPLTDRWTAMTAAAAPAIRALHVAVWTGREMWIVDGSNLQGELSSAAAYSPPKILYLYAKP